MSAEFVITYVFRLRKGVKREFRLVLNRRTLALAPDPDQVPQWWALLDYNQCSLCPLDKGTSPYCPIAVNLMAVVRAFRNAVSIEKAAVTVTVAERTYYKVGAVQEGLSSLLGIIMTTSGCPVMEPLKPMVRFHLPFASLEETVFRMVSMFLTAQFIRSREGRKPEWRLEGLKTIYGDVGTVNRDFAKRMIAAARSDANVNALVNLDAFAILVPLSADRMLKDIAPYFASYLR